MATNRLMTVLSQGNTSHLFRQCISSSFLFWGFVDWQWMTMTISLSNACVAVLNCSELVHIFSHPRDVGCAHPATGGNWAQFVAKDQNRSLHLTRKYTRSIEGGPKSKMEIREMGNLGKPETSNTGVHQISQANRANSCGILLASLVVPSSLLQA